jgi:hypothetical protein
MKAAQSLSANTVVQWHPDQITAEILGEVVAMSVVEGVYIGLDDVASKIWRRIEHPQTIGSLCKELSREFQGAPEVILSDVTELIGGLHKLGIVLVDQSDSSAGHD